MSDHISDFVEKMRYFSETIKNMPRQPKGIIAHHSVPFDKVYRQWDTNGDFWVWINKGALQDLPRKSLAIMETNTFGIPIYYEHPYWR